MSLAVRLNSLFAGDTSRLGGETKVTIEEEKQKDHGAQATTDVPVSPPQKNQACPAFLKPSSHANGLPPMTTP